MSTMDEAAIEQHEILESYIRAGFSRKEALELLKVNIVAAGNGES